VSAGDIIYISASLVASALVLFLIVYAGNSALNGLQDSGQLSAQANQSVEDLQTNGLARTDYAFFGLFIGYALALIVSSWFIAGNPLFSFIYIIIIVLSVIISAILSNVWESVTRSSAFSGLVTSWPLTDHLLTYLPYYTLVLGVVGLIVMYGKPYFSSGTGGNL